MDLTTERHDGVLCARVSGRIEPRNAGEFQTAITGAVHNGDRAVVLDFEELAYIGNVGVRALHITARVLRDRNTRVAVCAPQGIVAAVFAGSGSDKLITVYPSRAAALAALRE